MIEDIVDSGNTIASVLEFLQTCQPGSLKVCTLLDKEERREAVVLIHYRGFRIPTSLFLATVLTSMSIIAIFPLSAWWILKNTSRPHKRIWTIKTLIQDAG